MLRKILASTFILVILITSTQVFLLNVFSDNEGMEEIVVGEEPYLTVDFIESISIDSIGHTIDCKDVETIKGTYIIDGDIISYEYRNTNNLANEAVIQNVKEHTEEVINGILNDKSGVFPEYKNVQTKEISKNMTVKKVKTNGKKNVEILSNELKNKKNITVEKYYKKIKKIKDNEKEIKEKAKNKDLLSSILTPMTVHAEPKGGDPQRKKKAIVAMNDAAPTQGDRQDRLGLYSRTTGSQYNWLPTKYWVDVFEIEGRTDRRRQVNIGFQFNETRLDNLNIDDNETFEAEVSFYNYGWNETMPYGHAYIYDKQYFAHNIPEEAYPYEDTRYMDDSQNKYIGNDSNGKHLYRQELEEVSYCVGVADTRKLVKDTKYWCIMQGYPYHYYEGDGTTYHPAKGYAQLTLQRGYNYKHHGLERAGYKTNGHDEWSVFNEEYESFIRPLKFREWIVPKRYEVSIDDSAVYIKRNN